MEVPASRFPGEILNIIKDITESHFIAFDLEFSGLPAYRKTPPGQTRQSLSLQEHYEDVRAGAHKYQILQVGLTIVKEDTVKGCYFAKPYNFNINPVPTLKERYFGREWSYHSGAIDFLLRTGFKFDVPFTQGIPYLSRQEEKQVREKWVQTEAEKAALANMPFKEEDRPLLDHIREVVDKWRANAVDGQDAFVNIPSESSDPAIPEMLNRYQVRLTHQTVRNEFPGLKTATGTGGHFVQITNPTVEQQASQNTIQENYREREISKAIGYRWLMEAIMGGDITNIPEELVSKTVPNNAKVPLKTELERLQEKLRSRRKILVGHNCFTDLTYLYKCFIGVLPEKVEDFEEEIHTMFPAIIDTKYLASFGPAWSDTSLEKVSERMQKELFPKIEIPADFVNYTFGKSYHEAGYDSLQTANVLIKLSAQYQKEKKFESEKLPEPLSPVPFGTGEHYVTPPESQAEEEPQINSITQSISNALTSPVEAVKSFFQTDQSTVEPRIEQRPAIEVNSESVEAGDSTEDSSVLAVKKKQVGWSSTSEVEKIRNRLKTSTLYDALNNEKADSDDDASSDLLFFSTDEEKKKARKERAHKEQIRLEDMVEKGEIMPPWDSDFWKFFGNKLQMNQLEGKVWRIEQ